MPLEMQLIKDYNQLYSFEVSMEYDHINTIFIQLKYEEKQDSMQLYLTIACFNKINSL